MKITDAMGRVGEVASGGGGFVLWAAGVRCRGSFRMEMKEDSREAWWPKGQSQRRIFVSE